MNPFSAERVGDGRVFYGLCTFWTDDWSVMGSSSGIPVCPKCGSVGFETTLTKWMVGVRQHEMGTTGAVAPSERRDPHPGYVQMIVWGKGRCFPNWEIAQQAYASFLEREKAFA